MSEMLPTSVVSSQMGKSRGGRRPLVLVLLGAEERCLLGPCRGRGTERERRLAFVWVEAGMTTGLALGLEATE